jgi:hypothetical protein
LDVFGFRCDPRIKVGDNGDVFGGGFANRCIDGPILETRIDPGNDLSTQAENPGGLQ